jgi:hypothetical protein
MNRLLSAAVAACLVASSAGAVIVSTDRTQPAYTGLLAAPTSNSAAFRMNFRGSDLSAPAPNARTPWEEFAGLAETAYYNSVEAGGFAEYAFGADRTDFSLMWGSPDAYNTLSFLDDGMEVFSIAGNDAAITGTPGFVVARQFVNVHISDLVFDTVRFESTSDAFEFANVAPVPLPASAWMFIAAIAGLGWLSRTHREA